MDALFLTYMLLQVIDHYENPRNVGSMDKDDDNVGTGLVGAPACGDVMKLQVMCATRLCGVNRESTCPNGARGNLFEPCLENICCFITQEIYSFHRSKSMMMAKLSMQSLKHLGVGRQLLQVHLQLSGSKARM